MSLSKLYVDVVKGFEEKRSDLCLKLASMVAKDYPRVEESGFIVVQGDKVLFTFYVEKCIDIEDGYCVNLDNDPSRDDIVLYAENI
jgi:hypothetical protein